MNSKAYSIQRNINQFVNSVKRRIATKSPQEILRITQEDIPDSFRSLVAEHGDAGREALCLLLEDDVPHIRFYAANYLLRYDTENAKKVLEELSLEGDLKWGAKGVLERWESGAWNADLIDDEEIIRSIVVRFGREASFFVTMTEEREKFLEEMDALFQELTDRFGDRGREGLRMLAEPSYVDSMPKDPMEQASWRPFLKQALRCVVAGYLLRYEHESSLATLQTLASLENPDQEKVAQTAQRFIDSWKEGTWNRDPE